MLEEEMAQAATDRKEGELNAEPAIHRRVSTGAEGNTSGAVGNAKQNKKKDGTNEFYYGILIILTVFILGFVCGKAFGKLGVSVPEDVNGIISLLRDRHEKHLFQQTDVENLKKFLQELSSDVTSTSSQRKDSRDPKYVAQLSHKEAMEILSQPVNPNAYSDFIWNKIYNILLLIGVVVFLILWTICTGA